MRILYLQLSKCFPLLRVFLTVFLLYRQEAMQQSYHELIMRVPLVKLLAEDGDSTALEALYNNVCAHVHYFGITQ